MGHKSRRGKFPGRQKYFAYPFFSSLIGMGVIFLVTVVFALVITKLDAQDFMLSVMSTVALCVGAYAGGYVSGKESGKNGLLMGILCGIFIFLIILLLSLFFSKAVKSFTLPVKLILTLACAGIGGIVGVNSGRLK